MSKHFVTFCLINFLLAASLGLALRYSNIDPMGFNFKYVTHAHSHVAMLGWVYLMLYTLMVRYFVSKPKPVYTKLFWITQITVMGMLLSFPFQGYAAISISFSTLHILCSYYFAYRLWKDLDIENTLVKFLVKTSLAFMLISTFGVWCLGPAVGLMGKASALYQIAIQFFLHFQFNGWFLIAVVAILFHQFQIGPSTQSTPFLRVLILATAFTFALPVQWFAPHPLLYWANGLGIVLQWLALYYFLIMVCARFAKALSNQPSLVKYLYWFALTCFILKIGLQSLSLVPEWSSNLYQYHHFVIGFIHLTMLGVISGFLLAFLLQSQTLKPNTMVSLGLYSFLIGFVGTESLLGIQGARFLLAQGMMLYYDALMVMASVFLLFGITSILIGYLSPGQKRP